MEITGRCFCGNVRYEATIDERRVGVCHCRDCQIFSGSAFRTFCVADPSDFRFTAGEPSRYRKTARSGNVREMAFCGNCGTHVCALPGDGGGFVTIRSSTSDQFDRLRPAVEVFCESRVSWLAPVSGARQFPEMP